MPRKVNEVEDAKLSRTMGAAMKAARRSMGLTQEEAAASAGTVTEVYGRIERGHAIPSIPMLLAICRALGAEPNELLGAAPAVERKPARTALQRLASEIPDTWAARKLLRRMAALPHRYLHTLAQLTAHLSNK